ncbi:MAG: hypothetical protein WD468_06740 [Pirellulales bacterium]
MSATFKNLFVGTSILALLILASGASAAPSLGYPSGRPYYGSSNNRSSARSFRSYAASYPNDTRQSFSYEPAEKGVRSNGGCNGHAVVPQASKQGETKKDVAAAPKTTRRSYSYEPATQPEPQRPAYNRGSSPQKEAWQYQKTDPRRNQR